MSRQNHNPAYSMRAFARSLSLNGAQLSRVLNKKQGLSESSAIRIAKSIGYNEKEIESFVLMVMASDARSKTSRQSAKNKLKKIQTEFLLNSSIDLDTEDYEILREWYNIAILELMELETFESNYSWIAKELEITELQVKMAIEKLLELKLIEFKNNKYIKTQKILKIDKNVPSSLMKDYYDQLLSKAKRSIYFQSRDERHLNSVTVSLDEEDFELLRDEIENFRSKFNLMAEELSSRKGKKRSSVYCLTTQFFRINKKEHL